jgi:hypothetical protein
MILHAILILFTIAFVVTGIIVAIRSGRRR